MKKFMIFGIALILLAAIGLISKQYMPIASSTYWNMTQVLPLKM